jgi:DNA polymerase V
LLTYFYVGLILVAQENEFRRILGETMERRLKNKDNAVSLLWRVSPASRAHMPLFSSRVAAGFPSPADDYIDRGLDLNEFLVKHPSATFFVKVAGDSMTGAGIRSGDILVVDRSLEASDGSIVIAVLDGELTVKRLKVDGKSLLLVPEHGGYPPIRVTAEMQFEVWGVVIHVIHTLG